jgi:hypothetical protein
MSTPKDMKTHLNFNVHQRLSLEDNSERALHQPIRFTSKSVLAEITATSTKGTTETPKAADTCSHDLNVETPPPNRTDTSNNRSITAKVRIENQDAEHTSKFITRNSQLPTAVTPVRTLKRRISSITPTRITNNKGIAEHDPANHEIKRLREEKNLKWDQIADILNKRLIAQGKNPAFTHNSVYSRYTRNAARIAAMEAWPSDKVVSPDLHL